MGKRDGAVLVIRLPPPAPSLRNWRCRAALAGTPAAGYHVGLLGVGKGVSKAVPPVPSRNEKPSRRRLTREGLLPLERGQYLAGIQAGLAGLDAARVVLAGVMKRMERARDTPVSSLPSQRCA